MLKYFNASRPVCYTRQLLETMVIKAKWQNWYNNRITKLSANSEESPLLLGRVEFAETVRYGCLQHRSRSAKERARNFRIDDNITSTYANKPGINRDVLLAPDWRVGRHHVGRQRVQSSHSLYVLARMH